VGSLFRIQVGVIEPETLFGIQLLGQLHNLFIISDVFQRDQIMSIQRYISTVADLMKQIFRNQNNADISVMAALRKQFTHLLITDVVQQIV